MKRLACIISVSLLAGTAFAKLPEPSDEAKAKAAEAKAKAAHGDKVAAYQLCQSQNAVAQRHLGGSGKGAKKVELPACADPGKFDPTQLAVAPAPAAAPAAPAAK
jgi:hypothetical protein